MQLENPWTDFHYIVLYYCNLHCINLLYFRLVLYVAPYLCTFLQPGNIFSTVRGLMFEWTLLEDTVAINQKLEPEAILRYSNSNGIHSDVKW